MVGLGRSNQPKNIRALVYRNAIGRLDNKPERTLYRALLERQPPK